MTRSRRRFIRRVRLRIRLACLVETAQALAPWVGSAVLALFVTDWLTPWDGALAAAGMSVAAVAAGLVLWALAMRITPWAAWRAAERGLGARDVFTTALEFDDSQDEVHRAIQAAADHAVARADPDAAIPLHARPDRLRRLALVGALTLLVALLPPLGSTPALSSDVETALGEEAERIEELAEALEESDVENREELAEELNRLAQELREAESLEQALESVSDTQKRLDAGADPDFLAQKAAVQGLAKDLTLRPLTGDAPVDAASQLEQLAEELDDLSEPELKALEDRLAELAASQASGNPALADQLSRAASSLSTGDLEGARNSLDRAAEGQRSGVSSARGQQALSETQRALESAAARIGGGDPGDAGEGRGQGEQGGEEAEGEGGGQGAQGEGAGQGEGQGAGGGGGQAGSGDGASGEISGVAPGEGGAAGQGGSGTVGGATGEEFGSEVETSSVYDPLDLGEVSELLQVGIDGGAADGEIVGRGEAPTERGESIVPYAQVLPRYLSDAADSLATLRLPPSMRGIVQSYFDGLADEAR